MPPPLPSSPPKQVLTIPSSPPLAPFNAPKKRFLDIDPSSDDIPVFSSDDLPPNEVFANPYQSYHRPPRSVKRQRSGTIQSLRKHRYSGSSEHKTIPSEDADDEGNTSLDTIRPPVFPSSDPLFSENIEDTQDTEANLIIQKSIENGSETVDLSNLSLHRVPSDIASLSSLIHQPSSISSTTTVPKAAVSKSSGLLRSSSGIDPSAKEPYTPLHAEIHLHLPNNELSSLPRSLTSLKNIRGLYLRKNQLRTLPWHISGMKRLRNLSIGENQIAYLPSTILDLEGLTQTGGVAFFPNPFFGLPFEYLNLPAGIKVGQEVHEKLKEEYRTPKSKCGQGKGVFRDQRVGKWFVYNFITATRISVFNEFGKLVSEPLTDELEYPSRWGTSEIRELKTQLPLLTEYQAPPKRGYVEHRFPRLSDLCLKKMATEMMYTSLNEEQRAEIYEMIPEHLVERVKEVLENSEEAVRKCGVCGREYVGRGTEWVEFWDFIPCSSSSSSSTEKEKEKEEAVEYFTDDCVKEILKVLANSEEGKEVGEKILGMKWGKFFRRFMGRKGEKGKSVVPLLREGCSWECADAWQRERGEAEKEE